MIVTRGNTDYTIRHVNGYFVAVCRIHSDGGGNAWQRLYSVMPSRSEAAAYKALQVFLQPSPAESDA